MVQGRRNPLHFGFARRLANARKAAGMNGAALSLASDMHRGAVSELEAGDRVPRVDTVEKLADVLHVSPCFLAYGIQQPCEIGADLLPASAGLPDRLLQLREDGGLSRKELGRLSGTSDGFVRMTETAVTVPNIAKVEALAKALQVSPCWLAWGVGQRDLPPGRSARSDVQSPDSVG